MGGCNQSSGCIQSPGVCLVLVTARAGTDYSPGEGGLQRPQHFNTVPLLSVVVYFPPRREVILL